MIFNHDIKLTVSNLKSLLPFSTYSRCWMVEMVGAYVDGRPIPSSSNLRTQDLLPYSVGALGETFGCDDSQ